MDRAFPRHGTPEGILKRRQPMNPLDPSEQPAQGSSTNQRDQVPDLRQGGWRYLHERYNQHGSVKSASTLPRIFADAWYFR